MTTRMTVDIERYVTRASPSWTWQRRAGRQIGLKQDAEYKNREPPKEDARQHLGGEPVLYGVAGEQHGERAGDYEPGGKHAKAIEHGQESQD